MAASESQVQLFQPFVFLFLLLDVIPDHRLISSHRGYEIPSRLKVLPDKTPLPFAVHPCQMDRALAFDKPYHCDIAYFGGIAISMCTWSLIRCPSSIRLSFCCARCRNTSPRCFRSYTYNVLRRHFGMNTTW